jgi:hypothetical protein
VANKFLDTRDGSDCNQLGLYIDWHCCQIDRNQLGLCVDEDIIKSIAISLDHVSMDVDGGFNGGFDGGFNGWFHLAVLGYQPQRSMKAQTRGFYGYQLSGFNGFVVKQTHHFTDLFYRLH